jgi:hypothetical protein
MTQAQTDGQDTDTLEQIRNIIAMATPLQRCAIQVITHLVKANRNDLAREVGDLMRKAGHPQGKDLIIPDSDVWDQMREAVARKEIEREEFRSWQHFMFAVVLADDQSSARHLEDLATKRLAP